MSWWSLSGHRALVTGANTGIGQAIAISLAQAGAEVICAGRSTSAETVQKIRDTGGTARDIHLDLADPMAARDVFSGAGIDILVNNAGIIRRADSLDYTEADWDAVMDINTKALFFTAQAFAREILAQEGGRGGKIINIASLLAFQGGIRVPAYTASKHAVAGLTKLLANEWASRGINVNAIAPGYIATNNTQVLREDPERTRQILERIPAARWGRPEDIGATAAFLASEGAAYIHGAVISVDGGWMAR